MADIFLSYSKRDTKRADVLAKEFRRLGWSVFFQRGIKVGERWDLIIERELSACRCVVVLWTQGSVESAWVLEEAFFARNKGVLFPVLLDDVRIPYGFGSIQHANLVHWDGDPRHVGFKRLVLGLAQYLGLPEKAALEGSPGIGSARRRLDEGKLILVGFGGVGKTSLVRRLILNKPFAPDEAKTQGISITDWSLLVSGCVRDKTTANKVSDSDQHSAKSNGHRVRMHVWDFGGQEIMHATHQFFLTTQALYLLVLNGRQGREDADAEYWLNMIASFAAESPVIVVLNKINEDPFDLNRRALQTSFPQVRAFVETDCFNDFGISTLARMIKMEISQLPHLRDTFPACWFTVKDQIAEMEDDYLSFDDYRKLCQRLGEPDPDAQEELASFLHMLGVALNYRDDPRLRDLHVLKPNWVTQGIYAILNSRTLAEGKGELHLKQLEGILDTKRYPKERHPFLLELMRKFELCIRFPEDEHRFLIPELLDKQEPAVVGDFPEKSLSFEYHYPTIVPEGLMARFIVRTSALSTDQPRWRTGVVLSFEGNRGLVKVDPIARSVKILVIGPYTGRRRLLAVIRSDFEHIHRSFSFRPEEMVPVPQTPGVSIPYSKLLVLERKGVETVQEVYGEELLSLSVKSLLDGIDLEGGRKLFSTPEQRKRPLTAFISFSHKDETLRAELETHLKLFKRLGILDLWQDRCITAGAEWKHQIDESLENADLVLLLVSADFIASDYCWDVELKRALELAADGKMRVVPVIIRTCTWQKAPFGRLQALPPGGKAITAGGSKSARDKAWTLVARGIEGLLTELRAS